MVFASVPLWVVVATQSIVISAPTDPVPVGQMVELTIETDLPNVIVQAVGRKAFDVVPVYQTTQNGLWVFCGPADEYLVTVTASGPEGLAQRSVKLLIGPRGPPDPVDPVDPPKPGPGSRLVIVEESGQRTADQFDLYQKARLDADLSPKLMILDADQPQAEPYDPGETPLPVVFVCSADGKPTGPPVPLPKDVAGLKELLK